MASWEGSSSLQEDEEGHEGTEDGEEDEDGNTRFSTNDSVEFSIALQELTSIRSHLYSAADYCESAYIYSDQKQAIFENLKDYSIKALVNAVDHVGTVASKLNEIVIKNTDEMLAVEANVSLLSQRIEAYHERATCEGLKQYQRAQRRPRYGQHYVLAGKDWRMVKAPQQRKDSQRTDATSDTSDQKSLSWHLPSEANNTQATPTINRSISSNFRGEKAAPGGLSRSLSGGQFSSQRNAPSSRPNMSTKALEQMNNLGPIKSLSSLLSLDETKRHGPPGHKKGLLSNFLGRTKSAKPKRLTSFSSFKHIPDFM